MIADKLELLALLEEKERRQAGRRLWTYYPDEGPLRRGLYAKHMQFFAAGLEHRERAAVAANRVGKSEGLGAYEVTLHLTGLYPDWWPGYRFDKPTNWLCGGDTSTTTRDVPCKKLFGPSEDRGTGMIPRETIMGMTSATGVPGLIDIGTVRHVSGGNSVCQFRSYDQGRAKWQGTERDGIWLDEEPPMDIYTEALIRTMTTRGMVIATFTPLSGLTDVALSFLPNLAPIS